MAAHKRTRRKSSSGLLETIRKPMAPPTRVEQDVRKYKRARECERLRRQEQSGQAK